MTNYRVYYEFLEKPDEFTIKADNSFVKAETPWGQGELDGELAYVPETAEEWKNLSREIAKEYNFAACNVTRILPLTLQGKVIADSE